MRFQERWDAMWMAITFEEAGEHETAASIYQETQRTRKRAAEGQRPEQRPRQRL